VNPATRIHAGGAPLYTPTFWTACAIHFTGAMSHGMFLLFPLFVRRLGGDELTIGLVLGTGLALSVALRPAVGTLLDRYGRRRVLWWSSLLNASCFPFFILLDAPGPGLFALAAVHLVAGGALFAGYFTYAADLVPVDRRVEGLAIFGVAGMAPNGIGPVIAEFVIPRAGWGGFFLTACGFALLSAALTLLIPRHVPAADDSALRLPTARDVAGLLSRVGLWRVMFATVLFGAGINAAFYFLAPFARDLAIARAAPFYAAYASSTILLRVFGRRLPDRIGPHRVAVPSFAIFAAGLAALVMLPTPGILVLAGIACGAGHGSLFPVLNGIGLGRTPVHLHGSVVSLYTAALDLGAVLGTPLCGALARAAGYRAMFGTMAVASVVALGLMASDRRRP
jgi:MFS family permease